MSTYILLLTLTREGREAALRNPDMLLDAADSISVPGLRNLGVYGVLGDPDFVAIVEADSNEAIGRFSLELGVEAGAHICTLPAVLLSRLKASGGNERAMDVSDARGDDKERFGADT